jgi:hypothetical protein
MLLWLCAAGMMLSDVLARAWPWILNSPMTGGRGGQLTLKVSGRLPVFVEQIHFICTALLLGIAVGLLCGDIPRRFAATLRGDSDVSVFGAMVGILAVMSLIPIKGMVRLAIGLDFERLIQPFPPVDRFVLEIIFNAVFIGLGATIGGLIGAVSSRDETRPLVPGARAGRPE